jgi:flavodoxin
LDAPAVPHERGNVVAAESSSRLIYLPLDSEILSLADGVWSARFIVDRTVTVPVTNQVLVAFYSRKGHTKELGLAVCQGLRDTNVEVTCLELEPEKEVNVLSASASSFTRSSEPIKEFQVDLRGMNLLVLGTPVWGGLPAPYIRSLLETMEDLKGLPVVLFATCANADRNAGHELHEMVRTSGGRPLDYHIWKIRKEGPDGRDVAAKKIVRSIVAILPSQGPAGLEE